jgi:hypothetical protein
VNIFDETKKCYNISGHARTRLAERNKVPFDKSEGKAIELINDGKLLLETDKFRYVKNGNLFFPLKKDTSDTNEYTLTTVLLYDSMVEKRFQQIVDIYHENAN